MRTVIFVFGGREENLKLQLPFMKRIIADNPRTELHLWNLTHTDSDNEFIRTIEGEGITVINDYWIPEMSWRRFNDVWAHYASNRYQNVKLVKIDDDVVFIETQRWAEFMEVVRTHPESLISAATVNNGASLRLFPEIKKAAFDHLDIDLIDVHLESGFALNSHEYFLNNWESLIGYPLDGAEALTPTEDWLSINAIGFDPGMAHRMNSAIGQIWHGNGALLAGRDHDGTRLGDEGAANVFERLIYRPMVVSHLSFGPQKLPEPTWRKLREGYFEIGKKYLESY